MKRLLLILILLLPQLLAAQSADRSAAQTATGYRPIRPAAVPAVNMPSEPWTAIRWGSTPCGGSMRWRRAVSLRGDGREGSVVLEVAGFGLTLGRAPETDSQADLVHEVRACETLLF